MPLPASDHAPQSSGPRDAIEDVGREIQALRQLFQQHVEHHRADEERAKVRHKAVMSILGDLLVRVP